MDQWYCFELRFSDTIHETRCNTLILILFSWRFVLLRFSAFAWLDNYGRVELFASLQHRPPVSSDFGILTSTCLTSNTHSRRGQSWTSRYQLFPNKETNQKFGFSFSKFGINQPSRLSLLTPDSGYLFKLFVKSEAWEEDSDVQTNRNKRSYPPRTSGRISCG